MRTKDEIMADAKANSAGSNRAMYQLIEILLDIRDLLVNPQHHG